MKTELIVNGHITGEGTVVSDEPVPLPVGPVVIQIRELSSNLAKTKFVGAIELAQRKEWIRRLQVSRAKHACTRHDKMSDIDEAIYGEKASSKAESC